MSMTLLDRRVPMARAIALLGACAALLAFAASSALDAEPSSGIGCSGSWCMPAGNYTLDTSYDSGQIISAGCYANGTTNPGSAVWHHFGWGSASYSGSGHITVSLAVEGSGLTFGGTGTDLVRACYYVSCVPQTATNMRFSVAQASGVAHTVWGHGKA